MIRRCIAAAAVLALPGEAAGQMAGIPLDTLRVEVGSRVSAALPVATRAIEVIPAETLALTPARTIAEALGWALGADLRVRSPAQADLAIRGTSFEQVLVLVDGVRVSDAQTGHFDFDLAVPLAEVERIEILRGPATALYGSDAVGGVVNIVTRGASPRADATVEAGAFGTVGLTAAAGMGGGAAGARVAGELRRSDGHRPGTDYTVRQARAVLDARLGGRPLRADLAVAARDFGARAFYTPPGAPFDEYEETRTLTASLAWAAPGGTALAVAPRLALRRHEDDFVLRRDDPGFYRNRHTTWQLGGEVVARYAPGPGLRLAAGGEALLDRLESTGLGDRSEERSALFVEVAAGRVDAASLNLGLRADWHSAFGAFLAPSLAGALRPAPTLRLRGSIGRAFRAPSWTDRFYSDPANVGDPDLDPERSWEAELGAELTPAGGLRLALAGFVRHADGLIDWARPVGAPSTEPWRTRNVEDARFRGLELEAGHTDLLDTRWTISWTTLKVETDGTEGYVSKYALRPLESTALLAIERELGAGFSLGLRTLRARRTGDEAYLRADLRAVFARGDARVYVDLLNLGDARYLDPSGLHAAGRAAFVGISWSGPFR